MNFRLYCLPVALCLVIAPLSAVQAEPDNTRDDSHWEIERATDPILDTINVTARLQEIGAKKSLVGRGKFLVLRCRELELKAFIIWGGFGTLGYNLFSKAGDDIIVRFDSAKPETERWTRSTDYTATIAPQPYRFMDRLVQHRKLAVRTRSSASGSLTAVFDLSEVVPVVREVTEACPA